MKIQNPRDVKDSDFPRSGSVADKLAFCVNYAVLAPSTYNAQPWHFVINGNTAYLFADRRHALPVIDPDDRELTMACGSALYSLRLAIRYFGYEETTELLPEPEDLDLLAKIKMGQEREGPADAHENSLCQAIPSRHTNRQAFLGKEVGEDLLRALQGAASKEGAWLHLCNEEERRMILRMVAEADQIQTSDKHFRRELASWTDPRRALSGDGMPNLGMRYADTVDSLSPSIARRFAVSNGKPADDKELAEGSPIVAILGGNRGGAVERLHVGQAYMRLMLQAEVNGLSVSPLNQPCEVPQLRLILHDEIAHHGRAQMILRIGYAQKPNETFTPRRAMEDVISFDRHKPVPDQNNDARTASKGDGFLGKFRGLFRQG